MGSAEVSIIHHVGFVLLLLWVLAAIGWCHPLAFFLSLFYLYKVNDRHSLRLQKKLQFEEKKSANERRLLVDSETVRWLNHIVERVWPICMEKIASQQFLLPIIPWFLDNYKPWTAKKAAVQQLYLGRSPPTFTEIRVLDEPDGDDHMVLELGMNFVSADDMMAVLAIQLRKRVGFGMRAKINVTSMHVEGKVLVGVKFIQHWPFVSRIRVCFVEPPYFQMTVKPIFHHGVDVSEVPGIAGWLDKLVAVAFEETLIEPNMLVIDMEKFASAAAGATTESWFTLDEKHPIAFAKVEIIEAADVKPGDRSGFADPFVKGQIGPYRFSTKIQKKVSAPKWQEEFKIPISSWEAPNILNIQICDKDRMFHGLLGECQVNINDLRGGQRHDKWLTIQTTKTGRLHLAITILEESEKESYGGKSDESEVLTEMTTTPRSPWSGLMDWNFTIGSSMERDEKMSDEHEPISIEGDISKTSQPMKGLSGLSEPKLRGEDVECSNSPGSATSAYSNSSNNTDKESDGESRLPSHGLFRRGLQKIGSKFHKNSKNE